MEFKISTSALTKPIRVCATLAEPKNEVLKFMKMSCYSDHGIIIEAMGRSTTFRIFLKNAEIKKEGSCLIQASLLNSILAATDSTLIHFKMNKNSLKVTMDSGHYSMATSDPKDYPNIEPFGNPPEEECFSMPFTSFRDVYKKTFWSCDKLADKYATNGICWSYAGKALSLISTDTKRISVCSINPGTYKARDVEYVVPVHGVKTAGDASSVGKEVRVRFTERKFFFSLDGFVEVTSSLVNGVFPPWRDVVSYMVDNKESYKIKISAADFSKRLDQAALINSKETNSLRFEFSKNLIKLKAHRSKTDSPEFNSSEINYNCEFDYDGDPFYVIFNPRFFREALQKFSVDIVEFSFSPNDNIGAVLFEDGGLLHIVMPVLK